MKRTIFLVFALFIFNTNIYSGRSIFRKKDKDMPTISIGWKGSKKRNSRSNRAYRESIFRIFNQDYFYEHLLPKDSIPHRDPCQPPINCHIFNKHLEKLLKEVRKQKKTYTYFEVLKNTDFRHGHGSLIVQHKYYDLVAKISIETPKTFIDPYCKGHDNQFFFYLSGGMNRHISGLTRVRNLELVEQQIAQHPRWKNKVTTPRKWYWIPKKHSWMEIRGHNIGNEKEVYTLMPSIYAVIADKLDTKENTPLLSLQKRSELIMQLCMDLQLFVDPHGDNFIVNYDKELNDYLISIIDTEHFPSLVGLKEQPFFTNHLEYYIYLGTKYFQDAFLQTKLDHKLAQNDTNSYAQLWT